MFRRIIILLKSSVLPVRFFQYYDRWSYLKENRG